MRGRIAFIGGGNMASAIIGGLIKHDIAEAGVDVVEPDADARLTLKKSLGINATELAGSFLSNASLVVWAVKPQNFKDAAAHVSPFTAGALHLSVAAGISSDSISRWLHTQRVVRSMPNTPALIGQGMTGVYAREGVTVQDREWIAQVLGTIGQYVWLEREELLDAVTALSGSGPAYVFYFLESMIESGVAMGLSPAQARQLSIETFSGASALARESKDSIADLRQRVTSKGGTTHAAISAMENDQVNLHFSRALMAARDRAYTLGTEFGDS